MPKEYETKVAEAVSAIDEEIARLTTVRNNIAENMPMAASALALQASLGEDRKAATKTAPKALRKGVGTPSSDKASIVEFLKTRKNVGAEEIRQFTGIEGRTLTRRLTELVEDKQIKKTGERRGTKYSPI